MEYLINFINLFLILILIYIPFVIYKKEKKENATFIKRFFQLFIFSSIIIITLAWWHNKSNEILLSHYGYNYETLNEVERFKNVLSKDLEKVKEIEISLFGIGWILKAIFFVCFYIPIGIILTFMVKSKPK